MIVSRFVIKISWGRFLYRLHSVAGLVLLGTNFLSGVSTECAGCLPGSPTQTA